MLGQSLSAPNPVESLLSLSSNYKNFKTLFIRQIATSSIDKDIQSFTLGQNTSEHMVQINHNSMVTYLSQVG